ncbi:hypothetical protein CEXT_345691 [Caerostris extrusa]|uniref:Uncharacterized protein n=1 Tax=Caerostris extrusa TaxID=172846 RepID=A0AAV4PT89_CAEEX|nr:hypothetical protein CEXT_345691 [Caerostris extrusa]
MSWLRHCLRFVPQCFVGKTQNCGKLKENHSTGMFVPFSKGIGGYCERSVSSVLDLESIQNPEPLLFVIIAIFGCGYESKSVLGVT